VYATALAAGYTPASEVDDEPISIQVGTTVWTPQNDGGEYGGRITFRRALMRSSNSAAVRVSQLVGMPAVIATAHRFGIASVVPDVPASALGAADVTPLELVTSYAPFANGGWRVTPRLVRRVEASDGTILWANDNKRAQVMDPRDAWQMTSMLRAVVDYGTGYEVRRQGVRGPVAGKTGTTNGGTDVWFVGYTPTLVAGFWFGYVDPRPIGYGASGGVLAAPAWADFYKTGWTEPTPPVTWQPPQGMTTVTIDSRTGYKANEWCPITQVEYFKPGTEPTRLCPVHDAPALPDSLNIIEQIPGAIERGMEGIGGFFKRLFKGDEERPPRDSTR
jgi:penicillin-binding protein 1A